MAPIKLEDHMKERLEERRMEPSSAAWERLSGQLDVQQGAKKGKRILWMAIAASFVGGILITSLFFKSNEEAAGPLVITPEVEIGKEQEKTNIPPVVEQLEEKQLVVELVNEHTNLPIEEQPSESTTQKRQAAQRLNTPIFNKQQTAVVSIERPMSKERVAVAFIDKEKTLKDTSFKKPSGLDAAIAKKVSELVAEVKDQEVVTDEELDALLLNAQRDIISKQIYNQKTNRVDANALLLDVEAEVDPAGFRDKIFEGLKDGFLKAKDAVANRNN